MSRRAASSARSGMALILTLGAIALAGGWTFWMQARAAALARAEREALLTGRLRVAAAEAAREAMRVLAADEDLAVDHLEEDWAQPMEYVLEDGITTRAEVEDAGRWYNWNNLSVTNTSTRPQDEILLDLMTCCGDFSSVVSVEALRDYLDEDGEGAYEADFYRMKEYPFQPPNRPLWATAELRDAHDFSVARLQPRDEQKRVDGWGGGSLDEAVTLVPAKLAQPLPVNVNTAGPDVLRGLMGMQQESAVQALLTFREVRPVPSVAAMAAVQPDLVASLQGAISVASSFFRVSARAARDGRSVSVMAWVERDNEGNLRVAQWMEDEAG